jgi:hypothetical protein
MAIQSGNWSLNKGRRAVGKVRMTEHTCVPDIQESFDYIYDYTYCDKCGSFDIGCSTILPGIVARTLVLIVLAALPLAVVVGLSFNRQRYVGCSIGSICLIAFAILRETSRLECKKCGNQHITSSNVLNYAPDDQSVIDVPKDSILKHHIKTINVWLNPRPIPPLPMWLRGKWKYSVNRQATDNRMRAVTGLWSGQTDRIGRALGGIKTSQVLGDDQASADNRSMRPASLASQPVKTFEVSSSPTTKSAVDGFPSAADVR